jgi:hypothetical protein
MDMMLSFHSFVLPGLCAQRSRSVAPRSEAKRRQLQRGVGRDYEATLYFRKADSPHAANIVSIVR